MTPRRTLCDQKQWRAHDKSAGLRCIARDANNFRSENAPGGPEAPMNTPLSDVTVLDFGVVTASGGSNVVMGLYTDKGGLPDQLVVSTASTSVNGGDQQIAASTQKVVSAGAYWIAAVYDTSTGVEVGTTPPTTFADMGFAFGSSLPTTFATLGSFSSPPTNYYLVVK